MSTLSGTTSKGEKTKPKFQSLDINSVFKSSRGENTEKPVQKTSSVYIKHGMQSLGKVPNARRAPANLPSLKSEHSGSDAAVPLVPPGATGWGKQGEGPPTPGGQQQPPPQQQQQQQQSQNQQQQQQIQQNGSAGSQTPQTPQQPAPNQAPQLTAHQQAIALPVTHTIPPIHKQQTPIAQTVTTSGGDKLWSTVMAGGNQDGHPPIYQSPQFQHEFPSLSAGDGGAPQGRSDAPYAGGLSLRPQTEGSWTQGGGQRPPGAQESLRPGSGPPGAPPQLQGLAGPPRPENFPPQMRGVMPPFMYKGSYPSGNQMGPPNQHPMAPSQHQQHPQNRRPNDNRPPRLGDREMPADEVSPRPIIKEEELSKLDEISSDVGWAGSDDIDYNQKLAFSDDENDRQPKRDAKHLSHQQSHPKSQHDARNSDRQTPPKHWNTNNNQQNRNSGSRNRASDEEDVWSQRQKQHNKEVDLAIQRAKQRKEEEEKRFNEEKQRAAKKLQELDEKRREKRDRDRESEVGTINPSAIPAKPINHVDIPLPDFQKEKERDSRDRRDTTRESRSKTPVESSKEDNRQDSSFRQLTQIEGKNFPPRKQQQQHQQQQQPNKPDHRDQNGPNFSRHFQSDLPPRFMKNRSGGSGSQYQQHYEPNNRWGSNQNAKSRSDAHSPEREQQHDDRKDYKRQVSEESYRSSHHSQDNYGKSPDNYGKSPDNRHSEENHYRRQEEDKWHREKERKHSDYERYDERRSQEKMSERDRPQRPDSRDSHASHTSHTSHGSHGSHSSGNRRSRDLEPKEAMGSWNEVMELAYEEKKLSYEDSRLTYDEKRTPYEEKRISYEEKRATYEEKRSPYEEKRAPYEEKRTQYEEKRTPYEEKRAPYEEKRMPYEEKRTPYEEKRAPYEENRTPYEENRMPYEEKRTSYEEKRTSYEEKREVRVKEEPIKRQGPTLLVPGPITRDRIEAEDLNNEKRNLTQLKKGESIPNKKQEPKKVESNAWADALTPTEEPEVKNEVKEPEKVQESKKQEDMGYRGQQQSRGQPNRGYPSNKSWGSWDKRPQRGHRSGGSGRRDYYGHTTDSDDTETVSMDSKDPRKKSMEKDDKNRENKEKSTTDQKKQSEHKRDGYVPKGEPSRHGRGGGGNFRGTRMGGLGKRIDGYGPPPSKSPFGNQGHDEKEKKGPSEESTATNNANESTPVTDKTKQNQEALAAGIFGKSRQEPTKDKINEHKRPEPNRNKSRNRDESDNSDSKDKNKSFSNSKPAQQQYRGLPARDTNRGRNPPPPRMGDNKRYENAQPTKKTDPKLEAQNILASAIADISLKNRDGEEKSDKNELSADSEGFQEVKSKKGSSKEKVKVEEIKKVPLKDDKKDVKVENKKPGGPISKPMTAAEATKNIPSLMATPVQPPPSMMPANKGPPFNSRVNDRTAKLAPRFAKQKLQKQAMHQQQHMLGSEDIGKLPQNVNPYGIKELTQPMTQPPPACAWDKPLVGQFKSMEPEPSAAPNMLGLPMEGVKLDGTPSPGHGASPNGDKMLGKSQISDKSLLDGTSPPVNTIIFENTNFKSAPGSRSGPRPGVVPGTRPSPKLEDSMENSVFGKPINDLLQKSDGKNDPIQLPVFKEDTSDMKLDFFGSDLTHLTDDKMPTKSLSSSVIKSVTTVSSTICNADSLNMKIASVKKVWETSEQESEDTSGITFGAPVLDSSVFKNESQDDNHEGYSPGQNQNVSTSTNVCKVKPTQQVTGSSGQTMGPGQQPPSAVMAQAALLGIPLSPPPMAAAPLMGAGVGLGPQQYTAAATGQHMGFQPSAHAPTGTGSAQYGMSTIPSPPTVLYNSTQQLQAAAAQTAGLYGAFLPTADQGVLGGQGRSQFSQYPSYPSLGQPASSPYNTQSVYLQTAHPPPTAQAPPEMYQNLNSYRLSATAPFGQSQQLNNPTTVLISSTSNSLMSASVKQSNQPISAIGTKAGGVGQAYQQQSQQGQQMYMAYDPAIQAANYMPNASVLQRGPGAPVQNNVMPTLQPSSSYYSGSTGGQPSYFQQPGSSTLQSATQMPQHQAGYGLQGNVFGAPGQSHSSTGLQDLFQGYNSHLFSTPMQMAAAISAQQYLKQHQQQQTQQPNPQPNHYMKTVGSQSQMGSDHQMNSVMNANRPQQLKSPNSQEALSSVFNSAPQIPSPKSRPQSNKHNSQSSSPTSQRKYNFYQGVNQQNNIQQRYPTPIQRPVNFQQQQQQQQHMNSMGQNNPAMNNQKHNNKPNTGKPPNRQYYGGQSTPLSGTQSDKSEPSKVTDPSAVKNVNSASADMKDSSKVKEDTATLKD